MEKQFSHIKPFNFVHAEGWMRTSLHLSGDELWVYAIIFQMSQDGKGQYNAGVGFIREWLDCSENTAAKYLKQLVEKGLIKRHEETRNNVRFVNYTAILEVVPQNLRGDTSKIGATPTSKIEDINKRDNKNINKKSNNVVASIFDRF